MKKIIATLAVFSLLFSLTACHGRLVKETAGTSTEALTYDVPESFDTSKNYTVTFWAKNDTNKNQVAVYEKAISDFEKLYPNITVEMQKYTNYNDIYNDVINNIATKTTPDVCITYPDHIATYISGEDIVVPLNSFFDNEKYGFGGSELKYDGPQKDEIVSEFLNEGIINGTSYAIPFMRSTEACYINKTFVEKLGFTLPDTLTWDFIWEVSEAATEKDADGNYKVNGQSVLIPFIYKSTDNMMITMLKQKNAGYTDGDGNIAIFNSTTKELLLDIAEHASTGAFNTFKIVGYPANYLNKGQCIFAIDSTAGATWMGSDAPLMDVPEDKIVKFETEVMTVPQFDADEPYMISQGPSICVFNKDDPQQVLASWLFAQFLLTNDTQISYSQTEGYIPVTLKAQNSEEYLDYLSREGEDNTEHYNVKIKAVKLLIENTENTFVTPVFNGSTSVRTAAGELIENAVKTVRKKQTIDSDRIDSIFEEVIGLYKLQSRGNIVSNADAFQSGATAGNNPLPGGAKALLITLGSVWCCIIVFVLVQKIKNRKKE